MNRSQTDRILAITLTQGGGTFDAKTGEPFSPGWGYAVGVRDAPTTFNTASLSTFGAACMFDYDVWALLRDYPHVPYIGTWVDGVSVYLDPVVILNDYLDAWALADAFGQKAIYDFAAGVAREH